MRPNVQRKVRCWFVWVWQTCTLYVGYMNKVMCIDSMARVHNHSQSLSGPGQGLRENCFGGIWRSKVYCFKRDWQWPWKVASTTIMHPGTLWLPQFYNLFYSKHAVQHTIFLLTNKHPCCFYSLYIMQLKIEYYKIEWKLSYFARISVNRNEPLLYVRMKCERGLQLALHCVDTQDRSASCQKNAHRITI